MASEGIPEEDPRPTDSPSDTYRLVTDGGQPPSETYGMVRGSGGLVFVYFGILALFAGIVALIAASLEASGVAAFNKACSQNPLCTPQPDYSGSITAVGVIFLVLALVLFGIAYSAYVSQQRADAELSR